MAAFLCQGSQARECVYTKPIKFSLSTQTRPVCSQDALHNCITDLIMDSLPIGTADEELVLRADERRQMVAQHEVLAKTSTLSDSWTVMIPQD